MDELAKRIHHILQDPIINYESMWHPHLAHGTNADRNTYTSHE